MFVEFYLTLIKVIYFIKKYINNFQLLIPYNESENHVNT